MKKLVVALFLAVALVVPALADKPNMELIPKIGFLFSPEMTAKVDGKTASDSKDSAFSIGADFFFDLDNNLFVGAGLVWGSNHKVDDYSDNKFGFTNLYAEVKYKFLLNGSEDNPFFLYPLAQLGVGAPGWDVDLPGRVWDYEIEPGAYWGLGAGVEIANIIVEFIYGCNYATEKYSSPSGSHKKDFSYTAFRINVGYKFNI